MHRTVAFADSTVLCKRLDAHLVCVSLCCSCLLTSNHHPSASMEEVEDDKKVFEPNDNHEDDALPDPDEQLMLDQGNGRVWLVKVPFHQLLAPNAI